MLRDWRETSTAPAYVALADRIRLLVIDGRIPLGTRIPAERDLAGQLGISRTTVSASYAELREAGDRKSTRLNSSHYQPSRMPSSA